MGFVHDLVLSHLPGKRRVTPKGWILHNAVCCAHRGHKPDTRMRGNVRLSEQGEIGANCYNCNFKTRFDGQFLSSNFEQFLGWLGVDNKSIQRIKMDLLQKQVDGVQSDPTAPKSIWHRFPPVDLPEGARPLESFLEDADHDPNFLQVVQYLETRGEAIASGYDYFWCPSTKNNLNQRLLIPFYHNTQIVGWTARWAGTPPKGSPRYFNSSIPEGYLFNSDMLTLPNRRFVILTEGAFDSIAVQGVGALGSTLSEAQIHQLSQSGKEIIVLPDRQRKNQTLIDTALLFEWSVSFPDWEESVKDAADACLKYGQIYTVTSAIQARTKDPITIGIKRQMFRG
jgi:hypothetical protein